MSERAERAESALRPAPGFKAEDVDDDVCDCEGHKLHHEHCTEDCHTNHDCDWNDGLSEVERIDAEAGLGPVDDDGNPIEDEVAPHGINDEEEMDDTYADPESD